MIKVVLFDLDDTLLLYPGGGHGSFVRPYIGLLSETLTHHGFDGSAIISHLMGGVQVLGAKTDPLLYNEDTYWQAINPSDRPAMEAAFKQFYEEVYPQLINTTAPHPNARHIIDEFLSRGYTVIIATNPVYAKAPTLMRVEWAGIDPAAVTRVTHAQNSHFAKPTPHYFEEILFHAGYEPSDAIMVGDNWEHDIVGAAQAGLRTYWITNEAEPPQADVADCIGTLDHFAECVFEQNWLDDLPPREADSAHIVPRMLGAAGAVLGIADGIAAHKWPQRPDPNEWSPLEVVDHLAEAEAAVQRPRLESIQRQDNPFLRPAERPSPPGTKDFNGVDGITRAQDFVAERKKTVAFIEGLSPNDWPRPARHSIYGPTSLFEMALFTTRHDLLHITQLRETIVHCQ
jgi:FMN phosphatase YigB (HAD superfamily)